MNYLEEIVKLCKASVTININDHKDYYQTAEDSIEEEKLRMNDFDEVDAEILAKMIETDTIIRIQAYPHTPIGFYVVHHYDLNEALKQMYEILISDK